MKTTSKLVTAAFITALGIGSASAADIRYSFTDAIDNGLGEQGFATSGTSIGGDFLPNVLTLTATQTVSAGPPAELGDAHVYYDYGNAGVGVCKSLLSAPTTNNDGGSTPNVDNLCSDSADDNIQSGETLNLSFSQATTVTALTINSNHDGGFAAGDKITINGVDFDLSLFAADSEGTSGSKLLTKAGGWAMTAGNIDISLGWNNKQYYLEAITIVPTPSIIALFGLGLVGLGIASRRKRVSKV